MSEQFDRVKHRERTATYEASSLSDPKRAFSTKPSNLRPKPGVQLLARRLNMEFEHNKMYSLTDFMQCKTVHLIEAEAEIFSLY